MEVLKIIKVTPSKTGDYEKVELNNGSIIIGPTEEELVKRMGKERVEQMKVMLENRQIPPWVK